MKDKKPSVLTYFARFFGLHKMSRVGAALIVFAVIAATWIWSLLVFLWFLAFIPPERDRLFGLWLLAASLIGLYYSVGAMRRIRDRAFEDDDC